MVFQIFTSYWFLAGKKDLRARFQKKVEEEFVNELCYCILLREMLCVACDFVDNHQNIKKFIVLP